MIIRDPLSGRFIGKRNYNYYEDDYESGWYKDKKVKYVRMPSMNMNEEQISDYIRTGKWKTYKI